MTSAIFIGPKITCRLYVRRTTLIHIIFSRPMLIKCQKQFTQQLDYHNSKRTRSNRESTRNQNDFSYFYCIFFDSMCSTQSLRIGVRRLTQTYTYTCPMCTYAANLPPNYDYEYEPPYFLLGRAQPRNQFSSHSFIF